MFSFHKTVRSAYIYIYIYVPLILNLGGPMAIRDCELKWDHPK